MLLRHEDTQILVCSRPCAEESIRTKYRGLELCNLSHVLERRSRLGLGIQGLGQRYCSSPTKVFEHSLDPLASSSTNITMSDAYERERFAVFVISYH